MTTIKKSEYETVLAEYTSRESIISLLQKHREYMEMIPSMRRSQESIITIPLPLAKVNDFRTVKVDSLGEEGNNEVTHIPCDIAILMCDPEWQIKVGVEILVFIHRPGEDFSDLLRRWRQSQIYLKKEYEWIMPDAEAHMFSDIAEKILPLFVIFPHTEPRIKKGFKSANLPCVEYSSELKNDRDDLQTSELELRD